MLQRVSNHAELKQGTLYGGEAQWLKPEVCLAGAGTANNSMPSQSSLHRVLGWSNAV